MIRVLKQIPWNRYSFWKFQSKDFRRFIYSLFCLSLFTSIAKGAGALKELAIAWNFGVGPTVDAFVFISYVITTPISIWFWILSFVLVPTLFRLKESKLELAIFNSELLGLTISLGISIGLFIYFVFVNIFKFNLVSLNAETLSIGIQMIQPLVFLIPLGFLSTLLASWLMASNHHLGTLLESIPALGLAFAIFHPHLFEIHPLIWGSVFGYSLQLFMMAIPFIIRRQLVFPAFRVTSTHWKEFGSCLGLLLLYQIFFSFAGLADQLFAAKSGAGGISEFHFANRLNVFILGIGSVSIGRATLPIFSGLAKGDNQKNLSKTASDWSAIMFAVGLLVLLMSFCCSDKLVTLLLQRGKFDQDSAKRVIELFNTLAVLIPFSFSNIVLVSYANTLRRFNFVALVGLLGLTTKVLGCFCFQSFGLAGLAWATVLMYVVMTTSWFFLFKIL